MPNHLLKLSHNSPSLIDPASGQIYAVVPTLNQLDKHAPAGLSQKASAAMAIEHNSQKSDEAKNSHPLQVVIAGHTIRDPLNTLATYCKKYHKTIKSFDQFAYTQTEIRITEDLVKRTKILNSRIGNRGSHEVKNFVNKPIDWSVVNSKVSLIDADPLDDDGLYDHAEKIYKNYFQFNVRDGKVSKVLYLFRPNFFPILDSRVKKNYRRAATAEANRLRLLNPKFINLKRAYWSAIRNDLIANEVALRSLKESIDGLTTSNCELDGELIYALKMLSNVRLLDILTWNLG